jgi:hypothetical protein
LFLIPGPKNNTPFTKNRREIVTIQKNDRLGFISFEKAFKGHAEGLVNPKVLAKKPVTDF